MMAPVSNEEHYNILLSLLLNGLAHKAVLIFFDKEFPSINLQSTLKKNCKTLYALKIQKHLSKAQWDLLFPKNNVEPNSMTFDVTLMICLIRHLTNIDPRNNGFDRLPSPAETNSVSDLARIKWYRNKLSHRDSNTTDSVYFTKAWDDLSSAVGRLGGQQMKQECQELKSKILDPSNQLLMREIRQSQKEIEEMRHKIDNLESGHEEMKDKFTKLRNSHDTLKKRTNDSLQNLPPCHNVFESADPDVPSTSQPLPSSRFLQSGAIETKHEEDNDIVENNTEEENKAAHRTTEHKNKPNEEKGHFNHGYTEEGAFHNISGDNVEGEIEVTNHEDKRHINLGFADSGSYEAFIGNSLNSDLPPFTTPMGENQYQPHKTECKIPWRDSKPWPQITCSLSVVDTENVTEPTNGRNMQINNDNRRRDSLFLRNKNKNCFLRGLIFMLIVFCISGAMLWIINNEYFFGSKDLPNIIVDPPIFPDKCDNGMSTVTVGEPICIPSPQKFTSNPSRVDVLQVYSQYLSAPHDFSFNISSDAFEAKHGSWTIKYNSSKTEEQLLFMIEKATCHINGIYEIRAEYEGNVSSSKFEIKLKDPPLQQNVTRIKDSIYVHCKMIKTCVASSLALFRNDGGSSRMIPDINVCSYNDKESGTTVTVDAIIPASWFSGNQTISCVPLMTDPELAANLTSTTRIPVCEGDCVPDCTDDPQGEAYFPDKNDCTKFFQCSNGKLVSQSCAPSTYWSTTECTCVHFDDAICNIDNNRFLNPLLSIEKCTKSSLV